MLILLSEQNMYLVKATLECTLSVEEVEEILHYTIPFLQTLLFIYYWKE